MLHARECLCLLRDAVTTLQPLWMPACLPSPYSTCWCSPQAALQQQLQEEARLAAQLAAKQISLQQLEQQANAELQDIENRKQRIAAATQEQQGKLEAAAREKRGQVVTVSGWRAGSASWRCNFG